MLAGVPVILHFRVFRVFRGKFLLGRPCRSCRPLDGGAFENYGSGLVRAERSGK
jgi:hypothetical protein